LTHYVETRTGQAAPTPLTNRTYEGVVCI
jgi:hypothetical protein